MVEISGCGLAGAGCWVVGESVGEPSECGQQSGGFAGHMVAGREGKHGAHTLGAPGLMECLCLAEGDDLVECGVVLEHRHGGCRPGDEVVLSVDGGDAGLGVELVDGFVGGEVAEAFQRVTEQGLHDALGFQGGLGGLAGRAKRVI